MYLNQEITLILLVISYIAMILLFLQNLTLKNKFKKIFTNKNNLSLDEVFINQTEKIKTLTKENKYILKELERINKESENMIRDIKIKRYNPFQDTGSDQSFTISLLNGKNNGLVLSALHLREGVRIYAKPIKNNSSEYRLSDEEMEILKQ